MKALLIAIALPFGLALAASAHAQVPAAAPAGTTGLCKDGSYTSADTKRGACRGHKGVKDWYAADAAAPAATKADKADTAATETKASKRASKASKTSDTAAAAPAASAPAGSTGLCKDGSYTDTDTKRGACRGHQGVKEWYGPSAATTAAAPAKTAAPSVPVPPPAAAPAKPVAPAPSPAPASAPSRASTTPSTSDLATRAAAPGGGTGKVWVNTETKVYHCQSDRYYGKTKQGEYMSEADALAKGNHASHGKSCSQ